MKKLAFWAREHKTTARLIIVIYYVLFNLLALFLGDIIHSLNIEFTPVFYLLAIVMTLVGWMIYPSKTRKKEYRNFFAQQKSADILLVSATFLFIVYVGNSLNRNWNSVYNPVQAISFIPPTTPSHITSSSDEKSRVSKKNLRKNIRTKIKSIRKAYKDSTKLQKTIYIILAIWVASLLAAGIILLGCHISCSGSEAIGAVVLFLGTAGVIFGLVKLIKRINKGKPKK